MPRISSIVAFAATLFLGTVAGAAPALHFCPENGIWTYALSDQRGLNSLVLQSAAVVNSTGGAFEAISAEIDLMSKGQIKDSHLLSKDDLVATTAKTQGIGGFSKLLPGLFCKGRLFGSASLAATPTLAPGQALLLLWQSFAWSGPRDAVKVIVRGTQDGKPVEVTGEVPIRSGASKTAFHFPLKGVWVIGAGPSFQSHHRWARFEEFAYDIMRLDAKGQTHTGDGRKLADYYAYDAPIYAAADGKVIETLNDAPEDPSAMRQPDESEADYGKRVNESQASRLAQGVPAVIGNHVVIDHGNGEYSMYAHMKPGSVRVKVGQTVKAGEQIGALGSTGNSTEPHLHFQICDGPDMLNCSGIPAQFVDLDQGTLQTGDFVTTK